MKHMKQLIALLLALVLCLGLLAGCASKTTDDTTTPTDTTPGDRTYTCTVCGDTYTETTPALGHDYKAVVTAPTCTDKGYTT